jgi:hypothetical protein
MIRNRNEIITEREAPKNRMQRIRNTAVTYYTYRECTVMVYWRDSANFSILELLPADLQDVSYPNW